MKALRAAAFLLVALAAQVGLGRLWPEAQRFVNALALPLALYGVGSTQRVAMLVGCAAGLLQDAWFRADSFGATGLRWTVIGWALGGAAERMDLDHPTGRLLAGAAVALADRLADVVVRGMLGLPVEAPGVGAVLGTALATGLLALLVGSILDRVRTGRSARPSV